MAGRIDIAAVKAQASLADIVGRYVPLRANGRELVGLCPFHDERTPSFNVVPDKGFYHCFGCGAHGDVLDFVMAVEGVDLREAAERLGAGRPPDARAIQADRERAAKRRAEQARAAAWNRRAAWDIWRAGRPVGGTVAERYLESRGLVRPRGGWPPTLRFARSLAWKNAEGPHPRDGSTWPALLALFSRHVIEDRPGATPGPGGVRKLFCGVHRTYLAPDGRGRADLPRKQQKKMLAPSTGAAIWLDAPGPRVWVGEGIETTLSCRQKRPRRSYAVAGSIDRLAALCLPPVVKEIVLIMDNDMKDPALGPRVVERARLHYGRAGVKVFSVTAARGCDFNDMIRSSSSSPGADPGTSSRAAQDCRVEPGNDEGVEGAAHG